MKRKRTGTGNIPIEIHEVKKKNIQVGTDLMGQLKHHNV